MKIKKFTIKNVKSFGEEVKIEFDNEFNVLIGPNGGGKSNLLDILTIIMRTYFLSGYYSEPEEEEYYPPVSNFKNDLFYPYEDLDRFIGDKTNSKIEISLEVNKEDIENLEIIKNNLDKFMEVSTNYNLNIIWNDFKDFDFSHLNPGDVLTYKIEGNSDIVPHYTLNGSNPVESLYLRYLNSFNAFVMLSKEIPEVDLNNAYLYFSPYRIEEVQNLDVSLSNDSFYELLETNLKSTSKKTYSLLKLATYHFAEKRESMKQIMKILQNNGKMILKSN